MRGSAAGSPGGSRRPAVVQVMGWRSRQYGSFERFLVALTHRLDAEGAASHFVFPAQPSSRDFVSDSRAEFHALPSPRSPTDPRFLLALRRLLKTIDATHLHAHFGVDAYHALAVARSGGVQLRFVTQHITPGTSRLTASRARHRWLARQVLRYFAVSRHVADRLCALGVPPAKIDLCYLGADPGAYRPDSAVRVAVRQELGVHPSQRVVLSTSHLRPGKGTELLPEVAAALSTDPGDVVVLVAGDGPLRGALRRSAQERGLSPDRFRLLGVREDIPRLLAAADLFVFPTSASEGLPLGTLEAMAAGVPVVASAVSDLPALVGGTARLVAPGDAGALVNACRWVLGSPEEARRLADAGRRLVLGRLNVTRAAERHVARYLE